MQFGCFDVDAIIQVSDQPVEPSSGSVASTGTGSFAPCSWLTWYCQVVPAVLSALVNDWICFAASLQYSPTIFFCSLSRLTAASNWV